MADKTNNQFLREKLTNFLAFAKDCLRGKNFPEFSKKLDELAAVEMTVFIAAIVEHMTPYAAKPEDYVRKMMSEGGMAEGDLTREQFHKFGRYVSCFIMIVS